MAQIHEHYAGLIARERAQAARASHSAEQIALERDVVRDRTYQAAMDRRKMVKEQLYKRLDEAGLPRPGPWRSGSSGPSPTLSRRGSLGSGKQLRRRKRACLTAAALAQLDKAEFERDSFESNVDAEESQIDDDLWEVASYYSAPETCQLGKSSWLDGQGSGSEGSGVLVESPPISASPVDSPVDDCLVCQHHRRT